MDPDEDPINSPCTIVELNIADTTEALSYLQLSLMICRVLQIEDCEVVDGLDNYPNAINNSSVQNTKDFTYIKRGTPFEKA